MVVRNEEEQKPYVGIDENTFFSGLYVDESGKLALVVPDLRNEDLTLDCACCTHTFRLRCFEWVTC